MPKIQNNGNGWEWLAVRKGENAYVELEYADRPRSGFIEIGISDVRAADSIRIRYDFERDGYVIYQASRFEWRGDDLETDADWQEVAFVQAWAREETEEQKQARLDIEPSPERDR